jgi:hypothetical protein
MDRNEAALHLDAVTVTERRDYERIELSWQVRNSFGLGCACCATAVAQLLGLRGYMVAVVLLVTWAAAVHVMRRGQPQLSKRKIPGAGILLPNMIRAGLFALTLPWLFPDFTRPLPAVIDWLPIMLAMSMMLTTGSMATELLGMRISTWAFVFFCSVSQFLFPHVAQYWHAPISSALAGVAFFSAAVPVLWQPRAA